MTDCKHEKADGDVLDLFGPALTVPAPDQPTWDAVQRVEALLAREAERIRSQARSAYTLPSQVPALLREADDLDSVRHWLGWYAEKHIGYPGDPVSHSTDVEQEE